MRNFGQINVDKDIIKALKVEAANTDSTVKDLAEQAIKEFLTKRLTAADNK